MIVDFHLLRPLWLLALPVVLLLLWQFHRSAGAADWRRWIAEPMLRALSSEPGGARHRSKPWLAMLAATIAVIALAGPTWEQQPQTLAQNRQALVILLDLSPSMLAGDVAPNRLVRAKLKVIDLLRQRIDGQSALIAYAGEPHLVAPLTDDTRTVEALMEALHPSLMPVSGSLTEAAVAQAVELLQRNADGRGELLLVTDGVAAEAQRRIQDLLPGGIALSILGVGTSDGAPIPEAGGGFVRNARGEIVVAGLNRDELQTLAGSTGGVYVDLSADDRDLAALQQQFERSVAALNDEENDGAKDASLQADQWLDRGPWLVWLLLPLVAWQFRRGALFVFALALVLPAPDATALSWDELWRTPDQRGVQALEQGDAESATETFESSEWKGYSHYRNGNYEAAAEEFRDDASASGQFNLGNALTQLGDYDGAIEAYDRAAELDPNLDGVAQNRAIAEQLRELEQQQQPPPQQQEQQSEQQQDDSDQASDSGSGSGSGSESGSGGESSAPQDSESQAGDSGESGSPGSEQAGDQQGESPSDPQAASQANEPAAESSTPEPGTDGDSSAAEAFAEGQQRAAESGSDPGADAATDSGTQPEAGQQTPDAAGPGMVEQGDAAADEPSQNGITAVDSGQPPTADEQTEAWLRQIPDDPAGLLRRKFQYEAEVNAIRNRFAPPGGARDEERY